MRYRGGFRKIYLLLVVIGSISSACIAQVSKPVETDTVLLTSLKHWPQPTKQVPPEYPTLARQNNVEAEIMLSVLIGRDGKPKNIKVVNVKTSFMKDASIKPSTLVPEPKYAKLFHKPSIDAVLKWRFTKPLKPDSTTAFVWVNVPLKYQLKF